MKYVMFYEMADGGLEKARLDEFHARGVLLMAGPWVNPADGAIGIFTTREAAEVFIREDPFVQSGAVGKWTVREWNEVFV
ncbi:MAG: YciI family protein [Armatimonadota bacterium]